MSNILGQKSHATLTTTGTLAGINCIYIKIIVQFFSAAVLCFITADFLVKQADEIQEADKRWLCILFGIPYEAEYQGEGTGSALHIYNEEGEEVLTYTQGVGWHEKETKAETDVHSTLKSVYYEAYHDARKALNTGTNVEITNESVVVQSNFDMKA